MAARRSLIWSWLYLALAAAAAIGFVTAVIWRDDIVKAMLDPKVPFGRDHPPPAPNYASRSAWALLPDASGAAPVDVFFLHPTVYPRSFTSYSARQHWNAPINDHGAGEVLSEVMLPNYAGPFASVGLVYAPRLREASLYTKATLWDDAIEAREFAYADARAAFDYYLAHFNRGRPFILVGVEQGGELGERLLSEAIAPDPALRARLVAAYLIDAVAPADAFGPSAPVPACARRSQAGCLVAWVGVADDAFAGARRLLSRAMVWSASGQLEPLGARVPVCVNPLLGAASDAPAPERLNLGAAAATGLEWGVRPGFMVRQVGARCEGGVLRFSRPRSALLRPSGDWIERVREPGYNLFWADLQADAQARVAAWKSDHAGPAVDGKAQPAVEPAPARQSNSS